MTIQRFAGDTYIGLSSDIKPLNVLDGGRFFETDTLKIYLKIDGDWIEISSSSTGSVITKNSVIGDGTEDNEIQLENDEETPGNSKYYGTDDLGNKGFHELVVSASTDEYTVLVTQVGTSDPSLDVKENDIGIITCTRVNVGTYNFISSGLFIQAKTVPLKDIMQDQDWNLFKLNWIDVNTIQLRTYAAADISVLSDGICSNTYINFKVYK